MRLIREIQVELTKAKREAAGFARQVGDDMGCDGSGETFREMLIDIRCLEGELKRAREARL